MKALVFEEPWKLLLREVPEPSLKTPYQVKVRIDQTGICGTDLGILSGKYEATRGIVLGHEAAGIVTEVGALVTTVCEGDRVAIDPTFYCGRCRMCRIGFRNHCECKFGTETGVSADGTFAEFYVTTENFLYPLPAGVPFSKAIFAEPLSCVLTGVRQLQLRELMSTVVLGAGPIGMLYCYVLSHYGLHGCIVENSPQRSALIQAILPANWHAHSTFETAFASMGADAKVDVIVDTTGSLANSCLSKLRKCGQLLLVGLRNGQMTLNPREVTENSLKIIGSIDSIDTFSIAHDLICRGVIPVERLFSVKYGLEQLTEALDSLGIDLEQRVSGGDLKALKTSLTAFST